MTEEEKAEARAVKAARLEARRQHTADKRARQETVWHMAAMPVRGRSRNPADLLPAEPPPRQCDPASLREPGSGMQHN